MPRHSPFYYSICRNQLLHLNCVSRYVSAIDDMDARNECMEIMRELFRQISS